MTARQVGSTFLAWLLRLAIFGFVMGAALLLGVVALIVGADVGTVLVGVSIAAVAAALLADCATRPLALPVSVAARALKRAAMIARGRILDRGASAAALAPARPRAAAE
jgi:hypothetical protein